MKSKALIGDIKTLAHMAFYRKTGSDHAERLENFYARQAEHYDNFRERLLKGRKKMLGKCLPMVPGGQWADLGGGTGANLEFAVAELEKFQQIYIVDLSKSLLEQAEKRIERNGWQQVSCLNKDVEQPVFTPQSLDLVTFSYSLTMIPNWFAAVDQAFAALKPGGLVAVTDFFVSRKNAATEADQHSTLTRTLWPLWFGIDNVFLNPDHPPFLQWKFQELEFYHSKSRIPFLPGVKVPYYTFIGRKPG